MKKALNYFLAVLMVMAFTQVNAQVLGVKAGAGFASTASSNELFEGDGGLSYHAGVMAEFPFGEMLSLETGFYFARKGDAIQADFLGIQTEVREDYFYLNLPIMAKLRFPLGDMSLFGVVGPTLGYAMSAQRVATIDGESVDAEIPVGTEVGKHELKPMDLALAIGAGLDFGVLEVGLTYDLGLSDNTVTNDDNLWRKNRDIRLSVAYKFNN